ncbi:MAG: TetR/AcrR family transcriptional regulator [Candidatus Obscuribacterales bacterium]|nr:TetR/AcrR family transcriptional regulator [Candidatus Obscuribacterales bacterium]
MPKTGLTQEQLREQAIDYTVARMRKFGYEKVRLSDIAKDLGITHAALYSHFTDKAALFDAVSERFICDLDRKLTEVCEDKSISSTQDRITKWFLVLHRAKKEKVQNDPEIYRAFNSCAQMDKDFVKAHIALMETQLTNLAQRAIDEGSMKGNAAAIAKLLGTATIGFHHPLMVVESIGENREKLLEQILAALYRGLK